MKKKIIGVLKVGLLLVILLWTLFPIYWMLSLSIRGNVELTTKLSLLPKSFSVDHFVNLFETKSFGLALKNSIEVTLISLSISLVCGIPCAYIFSKKRFHFGLRKPSMFWVMLTRVLPPIAFAIPLYTMMNKLGMLNTKIPITLSHVLINIPFIIWFLIPFFASLPEEVCESAKVDGATEWQLFRKILMPLVAPGVTAVAILSFISSWNEYLYGAIFVQSPQNFTVPLTLATLNTEQELAQWGNIAAGGVLSLIPIALFVIFAQNYLISGLSSGAVKE